jgi:hypothetical protein
MDAEHNDGYIHYAQFRNLLKHIGAYKYRKEALEAAHFKVLSDVLEYGGKLASDDAVADQVSHRQPLTASLSLSFPLCLIHRLSHCVSLTVFTTVSPSLPLQMYSKEVLAVFRKRDATLKQLYAHYATLDLTSADVTSWKAVKQANRSININEVLIMLLNFEIVPHLVWHPVASTWWPFLRVGALASTGEERERELRRLGHASAHLAGRASTTPDPRRRWGWRD